jgi:flagellar biosynthesis protein FliP
VSKLLPSKGPELFARIRVLLAAALLLALLPAGAFAQGLASPSPMVGPPAPTAIDISSMTPVSVLQDAANAVPGLGGSLSGALNVVVLLTVLSLVPTIMIMCTCFVRFVIVFGLLKQALGAQNIPPAQVITALSLFMTFMVMSPTIERINKEALAPYQRGEITSQLEMWERARQPIRDFMFAQIDAADNWSAVYMVLNYRGVDTSQPEKLTRADVDTVALIPAYMLSELKVAFLLGFRVYLPFLIIDMVISSLLISMSMMMLPPVLISLPFKLLLFVLVDGWQLIVGSLMQSVVQPGG